MIDWCRLRRTGRRVALGVVLVHAGIAADPLRAQVVRVTPTLVTTQVYDTNLFSTPTGRQVDFITRVTPGLESEIRSPLWTLSGRYGFDVERFADRTDLSSMSAGQHALGEMEYRPTRRLTLAARAELSRTQTPGELNAATGLAVTRAPARRIAAQSSLARQIGSRASGAIEYSFSDDRVAGGIDVRTHRAAGTADRHLSPRDTVSGGYRLHHFDFATSSATSHALHVGWKRAITRHTSFAIDGGPNVTTVRRDLAEAFGEGGTVEERSRGSIAFEVQIAIRRRCGAGECSLIYARSQATVIGLAGLVDTQSVAANAAWRLGRVMTLNVTPALYRSEQGPLRADVYRLAIGARRPIASGLALEVAFDGSVQHGSLYPELLNTTIPRQAVILRVVASSDARSR